MFKVFINDGTCELPEDDIFYIVSKEGIFLKKKLGILESINPVNNIGILNSLELNSFAKLHIPKIPFVQFTKIVNFFKEVYNSYKGESIVLIYYNENNKKFKFHVPEQQVSLGSVIYSTDIIANYNLIGDIHSHHQMAAFHSGDDNKDEKDFDGIHITVGNINNDSISISSSITSNGSRFIVDSEDYIHGISATDESKKFYSAELFENQQFNKDWLLKISQPKIENIFINVMGLEKRKRDLHDTDFNPCSECMFKDYKIELLLDEMTMEIDENDMENNFQNLGLQRD